MVMKSETTCGANSARRRFPTTNSSRQLSGPSKYWLVQLRFVCCVRARGWSTAERSAEPKITDTCASWASLSPLDAQTRFPRFACWLIRTLLQPGAIVVLHEGDPSRNTVVRVLGGLLRAQRRKLSVVTAGSLIDRSSTVIGAPRDKSV